MIPEGFAKEIARRIWSHMMVRDRMAAAWAERNLEKFSVKGDEVCIRFRGGPVIYSSVQDLVEPNNWRRYLPSRLRAWRLFEDPFLSIYYFGRYEGGYDMKSGDIVVDIGAHIGLFSLRAAKKVGSRGRVIAIEPAPQNIYFLRKNIAANSLSNVLIVEKGVWSKRCLLPLYVHECSGNSSLLSQSNRRVWVEVDELDRILEDLGVRTVNFVKMDIEGAEIEALKGARRTLGLRHIKLAIAAYHVRPDGRKTSQFVRRYLVSRGFSVRVGSRQQPIVYAEKL